MMMADEQSTDRIHVDSDWKTEAAREKERLAEQEKKEQQQQAAAGAPDEASFLELINLLAMQAAIALGGYQGPGGERIPANPVAARYQIDLLEVLAKKTDGNLNDEEKRVLNAVLHELRMHYVTLATGKPPAAPTEG
jgi:Domain of unknown function (DUF1844)